VTPAGELLGAVNERRTSMMGQMMKDSLEKWAKIPKAKRLRATAPAAEPVGGDRRERLYPKDGLTLRSFQRDFPGGDKTTDWMDKAWNTDTLWYNAEELKQWLPQAGAKKYEIPAPLVRRFARFNFVDMVRGQTVGFDDDHITASLAAEITGSKNGVVSIKFTGAAKAVQKGTWALSEQQGPSAQERGYDFKMLGKANFDTAKNKFTLFEIVAVGPRWGGWRTNRRENDLAAAPMGCVIKLNDEGDRVPPSGIWRYGWR